MHMDTLHSALTRIQSILPFVLVVLARDISLYQQTSTALFLIVLMAEQVDKRFTQDIINNIKESYTSTTILLHHYYNTVPLYPLAGDHGAPGNRQLDQMEQDHRCPLKSEAGYDSCVQTI